MWRAALTPHPRAAGSRLAANNRHHTATAGGSKQQAAGSNQGGGRWVTATPTCSCRSPCSDVSHDGTITSHALSAQQSASSAIMPTCGGEEDCDGHSPEQGAVRISGQRRLQAAEHLQDRVVETENRAAVRGQRSSQPGPAARLSHHSIHVSRDDSATAGGLVMI